MPSTNAVVLRQLFVDANRVVKEKNGLPPAETRSSFLIGRWHGSHDFGNRLLQLRQTRNAIDKFLKELGKTDAEVVRVNDKKHIRRYLSLDQIPGLLIIGMLASTRELPSRETLTQWQSGVAVPKTHGSAKLIAEYFIV